MRFPTMYVRLAKPQISICAVRSEPLLGLEYNLSVKLLTEHHLEFLSLKGGCTGLSESTLVQMSHCWKSHDVAHIICPCDLTPLYKQWAPSLFIKPEGRIS